ncbi:hypothetical protein OG350_12135 [Streptomyces achromogenes]|uniref:Uncharacterized protein n=1 Tax=Streptomyces achromogenes TaxID=67255 RepID=A0ABZ1KMN1_STRAH
MGEPALRRQPTDRSARGRAGDRVRTGRSRAVALDRDLGPDALAIGKEISSPAVGEGIDQKEATAAGDIGTDDAQLGHAAGLVDHRDAEPVGVRPLGDHPNAARVTVTDCVGDDFGDEERADLCGVLVHAPLRARIADYPTRH